MTGDSANSRYCETSAPAVTFKGMTRGTPLPRSSRMCDPGASATRAGRASLRDTVDENVDAGRIRLHVERTHRRRDGGAAEQLVAEQAAATQDAPRVATSAAMRPYERCSAAAAADGATGVAVNGASGLNSGFGEARPHRIRAPAADRVRADRSVQACPAAASLSWRRRWRRVLVLVLRHGGVESRFDFFLHRLGRFDSPAWPAARRLVSQPTARPVRRERRLRASARAARRCSARGTSRAQPAPRHTSPRRRRPLRGRPSPRARTRTIGARRSAASARASVRSGGESGCSSPSAERSRASFRRSGMRCGYSSASKRPAENRARARRAPCR